MGRVLRWYFALKYRVFRRESRPGRPARTCRALRSTRCPTPSCGARSSWAIARRLRGSCATKDSPPPVVLGLRRRRRPTVRPGSFMAKTSGIPAFRFYDQRHTASSRATPVRRPIYSRPHSFAGRTRRRLSYVNLLDGDAERVAFTVATRERSSVFRRFGGFRMALLMLLHPIRVARMGLQSVLEWLREEYERLRRRAVAGKATHTEGIFPFLRVFTQRRRARAADDGDHARHLSRHSGHLQHVHAVRRARASLRSIEPRLAAPTCAAPMPASRRSTA